MIDLTHEIPRPRRPFGGAGAARVVDRVPARRSGPPGGRRPRRRDRAARGRACRGSFGRAVRRARQRAAGAGGRPRAGGAAEAVDIGRSPFALAGAVGDVPRARPVRPGGRRARRRARRSSEVGAAVEPAIAGGAGAHARRRARSGSAGRARPVRRPVRQPPARCRTRDDIAWVTGAGPRRGRRRAPGTARRWRVTTASTFADVATGELVLYEDAHRRPAIAVNRGSAAERLGLGVGDELRIAPDRRAVSEPSVGSPRLHLRRVDSTNARARELAAAGAPHGMVVTATFQESGRGRQGAGLGRARRAWRCCARWSSATRRGCCRWRPASPSPRRCRRCAGPTRCRRSGSTSRAAAPRRSRSSGPTTSSCAGARSRGSWSKVGRRSAGR